MELFYYGSQDVPPSPRGRRSGPPPSTGPAVCEACSAPIPRADLAEGRASEIYGVALCGACRERAHAQERVELYFCDRCHVSVPVYRVDTGEALAGDGRILCLACRGRSSRRVSGLLLAALLVLAFTVGGWIGARERPETKPPKDVSGDVEEVVSRLEVAVHDLAGESDFAAELGAFLARTEALEASSRGTATGLTETRRSFQRLRVEFIRRLEILEGEALSLLRIVEDALRSAHAER